MPWTKAFGACDDPTYWYQIFNDCQPETCNASSVADRIINAPRFGRLQYWIYGYVLRSPVIGNIGNNYNLFIKKNNFKTYRSANDQRKLRHLFL